MKYTTIIDVLRHQAVFNSEKLAYRFIQSKSSNPEEMTFEFVWKKVQAIAAELQRSQATGSTAILLYPSSLEFVCAFLGCLAAGVVAVTVQSPRRMRNLSRIDEIVQDSQSTIALTTSTWLKEMDVRTTKDSSVTQLDWIATDTINLGQAESWHQPPLTSNHLAFLQYTSGSTGQPKGVMITHGNLLHNLELICRSFDHNPQSHGVIWLPHYHDMGLIGGILQALYVGCSVTLMSPMDFLQQPIRWLQAISRYQANTNGGPTLAYDLCVRKITEEQRQTLDLSSWDIAFVGAETVRNGVLERFAATFAPCGFRPEAFYPCYGMAETTLMISGGVKAALPVLAHVDKTGLKNNQIIISSHPQENTVTLVGCGQIPSDGKVVIVNPDTCEPCQTDQVGEIWVSSPSIAQGYWNKPQQTAETFKNTLTHYQNHSFLRTGDLGFFHGEELFITGRLKDLIIIGGSNYYPQDIEITVQQSDPALQPHGSTVFSVEIADEEQLVIIQEVKRTYLRKLSTPTVITNIRQAVAAQHNLSIYGLVLVKPGSLPKTSSGKVRRSVCKELFLNENLEGVIQSDIQTRRKFSQ